MAKRPYNPLIRQLPRFGTSGRINNPKLLRGINFWAHRKASDLGIAAAGMLTGQSPLALLLANMLLQRHKRESNIEEDGQENQTEQMGPARAASPTDFIPKGIETETPERRPKRESYVAKILNKHTDILKNIEKESAVSKILNKHTDLLTNIDKILTKYFGAKSEIDTDEDLAAKRKGEFVKSPQPRDEKGRFKKREKPEPESLIKKVEHVGEGMADAVIDFNVAKTALGWTKKAFGFKTKLPEKLPEIEKTVETAVKGAETIGKGTKGIETVETVGKGAKDLSNISKVIEVGEAVSKTSKASAMVEKLATIGEHLPVISKVLKFTKIIPVIGELLTAVAAGPDIIHGMQHAEQNLGEKNLNDSQKFFRAGLPNYIGNSLGTPADILEALHPSGGKSKFDSESITTFLEKSKIYQGAAKFVAGNPGGHNKSETQQMPTENKPPIDQAASSIPTPPMKPTEQIGNNADQKWLGDFVSSGNPVLDKLMKGIAIQEKSPLSLNNPGDIRPVKDYSFPGQIGIDRSRDKTGYVMFDKRASGWKALSHQLLNGHNAGLKNPKIVTTLDLFNAYAPPSDNYPGSGEAYANNIKKWTGIDPNEPIRPLIEHGELESTGLKPQLQAPDASKGVGLTTTSMENDLKKTTSTSKPTVVVAPAPAQTSQNRAGGGSSGAPIVATNPKNPDDTYDSANKSSWRPT